MTRRQATPIRAAVAALLCALGTLAAAPAAAENVAVYRAGDRVDPRAVASILGGLGSMGVDGVVRPAGVRTRSIRLLDDPSATAGNAGPAAAGAPTYAAVGSTPIAEGRTPTSLSLPVPFAFDSADLLPDARLQLDAVAEGIRMISPDRRIVIEGHTDAYGPDGYNQVLSERRAAAVRQYLISNHGLEAQRFSTIGLGEMTPLQNTNPNAGINRRVQFRGA
jgi:outer membrane protein OmpA-like peptidoglycan-associated protein